MKALLFAAWLAGAATAADVASPPPIASASQPVASDSQAPASGQPLIQSSSDVSDPMFGVHGKAVGLERVVQVLQWHPNAAAPGGYDQVWSPERIGPQGLDAAHANPSDFPINGQRWWSPDVALDGHPVAAEVLTALAAEVDAAQGWSPLKPDLSQMPPNLAVTFQPDGDGVSTSQDPAHPQVGDVRVQWRVIAQAPLPAAARLVDGHWVMPAPGAVASASPEASGRMVLPAPPTQQQDDLRAWLQRVFGNGTGWLVLAGLVLAILVLASRRRR